MSKIVKIFEKDFVRTEVSLLGQTIGMTVVPLINDPDGAFAQGVEKDLAYQAEKLFSDIDIPESVLETLEDVTNCNDEEELKDMAKVLNKFEHNVKFK